MSEEYSVLEQLKREVYNLRACSATVRNMLNRDNTPIRQEAATALDDSTGKMFDLVHALLERGD